MSDKQYPGIKRIISQASHRNGVGGANTVVSIFEPEPYDEGEDLGVFIAMSISPDRPDNELSEYVIEHAGGIREARFERNLLDFATHTYAVNISSAAAGDIGFGEGNSWRAGDHWGPGLAQAWRDQCLASEAISPALAGIYSYDPFDDEQYLDTPGSTDGESRDARLLDKVEQDDLDILYQRRKAIDEAIAINEARAASIRTAILDVEPDVASV